MITKYDKLEIRYIHDGVKKTASLHDFRCLFSNELNAALGAYIHSKSLGLEDWQKGSLETEFFQNFGDNFNTYTSSGIKIVGVY